ncbi:bifunctional tetrahydrofolate synthase/dihydrofolate synthase [Arenicella sp. 4NH20-0111]|uniref:bifunctional folylpolyglutamate synthase/dihydrofolate synthase n=1 Tax=Arenicella sp. 4NH20-0111 TaxID=3127648 RepID=UPI00310634CF
MFDSDSVEAWVDYIQTLHAREIDLSLERVDLVYRSLFPAGVPFKVISVAGTNGKGSTSELLLSLLLESGFCAAKFTSPHISHFNERFNVGGIDVADEALLSAFRLVEETRGDVAITYFEYGVLLACIIFAQANVDIAILEVGLGGRLDAVNVVDSDIAIITSISLDHTDWLGDTLEKIAFEKVGIARESAPCVVGVRKPQKSMMNHLASIKAVPNVLEQEFRGSLVETNSWEYSSEHSTVGNLPLPFGQSGVQLDNACLAIRALELLDPHLLANTESIASGIGRAALVGRCQIISEHPLIVLDVAHNEASVERLSNFLAARNIAGRIVGVCGMLKDKEIGVCFEILSDQIDVWHFAGIDAPRGASAEYLLSVLRGSRSLFSGGSASIHNNVTQAYKAAMVQLREDDCLVVFGSFYIAGDIIRCSSDLLSADDNDN